LPSDEDRATVSDNMHKNLVKFGRGIFEYASEDKPRDRQTYVQTRYHNTSDPYWGQSKKIVRHFSGDRKLVVFLYF